MIVSTMGRFHRPRGPRHRTSLWQPVPLHLPIDRPGPSPDREIRYPTQDEPDGGLGRPAGVDDDDDVGGKHVIVIDLA